MFPTDIAFVGNDDLLVTEKNEGTVRRIVNETLLPDPLINLNVSTIGERGLLGIVSTKNADNQIHVFLFYSESKNRDGKVEYEFRKTSNTSYGKSISTKRSKIVLSSDGLEILEVCH